MSACGKLYALIKRQIHLTSRQSLFSVRFRLVLSHIVVISPSRIWPYDLRRDPIATRLILHSQTFIVSREIKRSQEAASCGRVCGVLADERMYRVDVDSTRCFGRCGGGSFEYTDRIWNGVNKMEGSEVGRIEGLVEYQVDVDSAWNILGRGRWG